MEMETSASPKISQSFLVHISKCGVLNGAGSPLRGWSYTEVQLKTHTGHEGEEPSRQVALLGPLVRNSIWFPTKGKQSAKTMCVVAPEQGRAVLWSSKHGVIETTMTA